MTAIATTRSFCLECGCRQAFRLPRALLVCEVCSTVLAPREPRVIFALSPSPLPAHTEPLAGMPAEPLAGIFSLKQTR